MIVSLAGLLKASDWFVDSAEKIGLALGISPFIIGVTIIAFGTSLPELAASIAAVFDNESSLVLANALGSNITNVTLILSLVAIIGGGIVFEKDMMSIDIPLLITSAALLCFVLYDLHISIFDAFLLLGGLAIFLIYSFKGDENSERKVKEKVNIRYYLLVLVSGVMIYFGAKYTIFGITKLSEIAEIDPDLIGLTLLALGTSLPELIVSITAARKGSTEIAIGNVLGSNIFNTYAVVGIPAFFGDIEVSQNIMGFSLPLMVTITLLLAFMCFSKKISRWEGWMLLLFYVFYFGQLLTNAGFF